MPVKSGTSHALSAFLLMIASAFIVKYLEHHQTFEWVLINLNSYAAGLSGYLNTTFEITMRTDVIVLLFVASFLCFVWGVIYHLSRKRI
jgi:sensor histidine kinase YesM